MGVALYMTLAFFVLFASIVFTVIGVKLMKVNKIEFGKRKGLDKAIPTDKEPDNDIEFKKWRTCLQPKCKDEMEIWNTVKSASDIGELMQVVEHINTSSGNIDGKRLYIIQDRDYFQVMEFVSASTEDNKFMLISYVRERYNWSDYNGIQGALLQAIYYIYQQECKQ